MIIECPNCSAQYDIGPATALAGRKTRCSQCGHVWQPIAREARVEDEPASDREPSAPSSPSDETPTRTETVKAGAPGNGRIAPAVEQVAPSVDEPEYEQPRAGAYEARQSPRDFEPNERNTTDKTDDTVTHDHDQAKADTDAIVRDQLDEPALGAESDQVDEAIHSDQNEASVPPASADVMPFPQARRDAQPGQGEAPPGDPAVMDDVGETSIDDVAGGGSEAADWMSNGADEPAGEQAPNEVVGPPSPDGQFRARQAMDEAFAGGRGPAAPDAGNLHGVRPGFATRPAAGRSGALQQEPDFGYRPAPNYQEQAPSSPFAHDFDRPGVLVGERSGTQMSGHEGQTGGRKRSRAGRAFVALCWLLLIGLLAMAGAGAALYPREVVRAVPGTAKFYAAIGRPVNVRGLDFGKIRYKWIVERGQPKLVVGGVIKNVTGETTRVPDLVFVLFDGNDKVLYKWAAQIRNTPLPGGKTTRFAERVPGPPELVRRVEVRFVGER